MRSRCTGIIMVVAAVAITAFWTTATPASGQQASSTGLRRTADGKPDLNGIWQSVTTANWDILAHEARPAPHPELMGAWAAQPGGQGIVEGNEIPYKPEALAKRKFNYDNRMAPKVTNDPHRFDTGDPEIQCYRAGVPRANYMPFPFQIFQTREQILMVYEYKGAVRTVYMDPHYEAPADSWMGWSNGRWEGDTLVIDVTAFNGHTWFDRAGNYASENLHVVERYTPIDATHLQYEATIEDPTVFTRPWKVSFPLYKRIEPNVQLVEFNCVPFVEEMMYGPVGLYKPPAR